MNTALYGLLNTIIGIVFLVLLLGIGVYGVLRTSGRPRILLEVGIGLLLLSRLGSMAFFALFQTGRASASEMMQRNLVQGVIAQVLSFAGVLCLVLAAIHACDQLRRRPSALAGQHQVEGGYPAPPGFAQGQPSSYPQHPGWPQTQPRPWRSPESSEPPR